MTMTGCFGARAGHSTHTIDAQGNRTSKKLHLTTAIFSDEEAARGVAISVENLNSVHGVVEERIGGTFYSWKKRHLRLEDGYLLCYKADAGAACRMLPLHLCMVRPSRKTSFKVVCATKFNLKLRAATNAAMREWVAAIQNGIAKALSSYNEPKSLEYTGKDLLDSLRRVNPLNQICADCSAQDPTWISTSIGCLICIECSGVHRSLGTHISKIRSFELDRWSDKIEMVEKLDNADVNSVFEFHIPQDHQKPTILSDRESREKYITDKYVNKVFMKKQSPKSPPLPAIIVSEICERLKPTSHIGSNVFAKKMPYGPEQGRKLSLGSTVLDRVMASPMRRNSLAPSPSSRNPRSPLSGRRSSLLPLRRSSMMPAIGGSSHGMMSGGTHAPLHPPMLSVACA